MRWHIRTARVEDRAFLAEMILEAAFHPERPRPPSVEALQMPQVACWLDDWGRAGDGGVVAVDEVDRPVGAAWYRLFSGAEPGLTGFIDGATPVVAIATVGDLRGQGIGGALLDALGEQARAEGRGALSLNVGRSNPAARLYLRKGFVPVEDRGEGPLRMCLDLTPAKTGRGMRLSEHEQRGGR